MLDSTPNRFRAGPTVPPLHLVSLLSANSDPFYAALAEHLSDQGLPLHFGAGTGSISDTASTVTSLCGLLYLRHQADVVPLVAPVAEDSGSQRPVYFSDVVVRRDHPATRLIHLQGADWALNERASFSGYVALLAGLRQAGLDSTFLRQASFTGSHLASLDRVRGGLASATAVDSLVFDLAVRQQPALASQLRVVASFGPFPAPPVVVHRTANRELQDELRTRLSTLHHSREGRRVLALGGVTRYAEVSAEDYRPISAAERLAAPMLEALHA